MIVNDIIWIFFWGLFFSRFEKVNGWGFNEVAMVFGLLCFSYGISGVLFENRKRIAEIINEGQLDYYLTLPVNPLVHILISKMDAFSLGDTIFGAVILAILTPPAQYPLVIYFTITAMVWLVSVEVIAGSLAFFFGNTQRLSKAIRDSTLAFGMYPIGMFDDGVKFILMTVIPVAFISAIPIELILNFSFDKFLMVSIATLAVGIIALVFFFFGLKFYESGNYLYTKI
jgi:ABC-2 type transport system permease protein